MNPYCGCCGAGSGVCSREGGWLVCPSATDDDDDDTCAAPGVLGGGVLGCCGVAASCEGVGEDARDCRLMLVSSRSSSSILSCISLYESSSRAEWNSSLETADLKLVVVPGKL